MLNIFNYICTNMYHMYPATVIMPYLFQVPVSACLVNMFRTHDGRSISLVSFSCGVNLHYKVNDTHISWDRKRAECHFHSQAQFSHLNVQLLVISECNSFYRNIALKKNYVYLMANFRVATARNCIFTTDFSITFPGT